MSDFTDQKISPLRDVKTNIFSFFLYKGKVKILQVWVAFRVFIKGQKPQ